MSAIVVLTEVKTLNFKYPDIDVWIHTNTTKKIVDKNFLSIALDSHWFKSDAMLNIVESPRILQLAHYLSPGYLRIGGNAADLLVFDKNGVKLQGDVNQFNNFDMDPWEESDSSENCTVARNMSKLIMTGKEWLAINAAAKATGLSLLFDLNAMLRLPQGNWNASNAEDLLNFSKENNVSAAWQLGNEPNSFCHKFGVDVPPEQLGKDFKLLRRILSHQKFSTYPILVGPDVTRPLANSLKEAPTKYIMDFLRVAGKSLSAVAWHQYYFDGRLAQINDFLDIANFDFLSRQIREIREIVRFTVGSKTPIWITETSTAFGGGAPGLSDRFVASFLWLDKLGVSASLGVDVVVRQALLGGNYGLIDPKTLEPLPDWWVSLLFKKLIGTRVLKIFAPMGPPQLRIYAHCAAESTDDIVVYGVNLGEEEVGIKMNVQLDVSEPVKSYILTAPQGNLTSKSILLNGQILKLLPDGLLPPLEPAITWNQHLTIPSHSLVFIVLKLYQKSHHCYL